MNAKLTEKRKERSLLLITGVFMLLMIIILGMVLFSGCKKVNDPTINNNTYSGGQTNFNLRMTDAPGIYDAVNIHIIRAEVHSDVAGWIPLNVKPRIYNLLNLTNGRDTLIANGQVAVGTVSQVRLILGDSNTVEVNGQVFPLTTPSAQQSGLKLQVHAKLVQGVTYNMLIDFDAAKSIVVAGKDKYILKPVLSVKTNVLDGAIKGVVVPLTAQPKIYAINGTDSFSTYANVNTGGFFIGGLQAASYKVVIVPQAPYSDTAIAGVGVMLGVVSNIGLITVK